MLCLHGFTDTWRSWELVLPMLERHHDVLAPILPGHAGGPELGPEASADALLDALEQAMDDAGFATAHLVGNSLGGYLALRLAARGRAESVVALAPAGGWAADDDSYRTTLDFFTAMQEQLRGIAPHADSIAATAAGRRQATQFITTNYEHLPAELVAHLIRGAAGCTAITPMVEHALRDGWPLDPSLVTCPLRFVWGTDDRLLPWPAAAARFTHDWFPHADWIELHGAGHCPQLDVPLETAQLILGFTRA